jgi:hypothetical protein
MPSFGHRPVRLPCASCEFSYDIRVDTTGLKSAAQGTYAPPPNDTLIR